MLEDTKKYRKHRKIRCLWPLKIGIQIKERDGRGESERDGSRPA